MRDFKVNSFKDKSFFHKTGQIIEQEKPSEINTSDTVEISSPDEVQKIMSRDGGCINGYLTACGKMLNGLVDGKQASWQIDTYGYSPAIRGTVDSQQIDVQKSEFDTAEWEFTVPNGLDSVFKGRWGDNDATLALGKTQGSLGNLRIMMGRVADRPVYITIAQAGSDLLE